MGGFGVLIPFVSTIPPSNGETQLKLIGFKLKLNFYKIILMTFSFKVLNSVADFIRDKYRLPFLVGLCIVNTAFLFVNILVYKPGIAIALLVLDFVFVFLLEIKDVLKLFFFLLPFTFVFKTPGFSTSFVSILLLLFYVKIIAVFLKGKYQFNSFFIVELFLFLLIVLYGTVISLCDITVSYMRMLPSYFLYLALPAALGLLKNNDTFVFKVGDYCLWLLFGVLLSTLIALPFFYLFSHGEEMLKRFTGVPFAKGNDAGSLYRFSALNPDPNYSTVLLILPTFVLLMADLNKKQRVVGAFMAIFASAINVLSLSKMYYLCLVILICFAIAELFLKTKSYLILLSCVFAFALAAIGILNTPNGIALFNRFFSSESTSFMKHLTSNRSVLFGEYCNYLLNSPIKIIFGIGPTAVDKSMFSNETHNAFIGTLYQNGIIGTLLLLSYYTCVIVSAFGGEKLNKIMVFGTIICFTLIMSSLNMETSVFTPVIFSLYAWTKKDCGERRLC